MKIITYGEIIEAGNSKFTAVTQLNNDELIIKLNGKIRTENPYKYLSKYIEDMRTKIIETEIKNTTLDFTELQYCNSNGFYALMDVIEIAYNKTSCPVTIKRLKHDDWQQETLPILLNISDEQIQKRTTFKEEDEA
jgi:hypothetical protein